MKMIMPRHVQSGKFELDEESGRRRETLLLFECSFPARRDAFTQQMGLIANCFSSTRPCFVRLFQNAAGSSSIVYRVLSLET